MIDELDTFNALVTLALARVARFPGLFSPSVASEVALAVPALPPVNWKIESDTARFVFGEGSYFGGDPRKHSVFSVYRTFWKRFPVELEGAASRVTVNAPTPIRTSPLSRRDSSSVEIVTDARIGAAQTLPEAWALPSIDDVVLFSEDGWDEAEQRRLASRLDTGSTVTLVRPGERCKTWFEACRVKHDFFTFLEYLKQRADLDPVHHSLPGEPIMLTVFGVKARKL